MINKQNRLLSKTSAKKVTFMLQPREYKKQKLALLDP